ncbi:MAG: RNA polymerase Rpb4 family protein [Candidatus Micrarchaeia archaeon]
MIGQEIKAEDVVTLAEVKEILNERKKSELTYEQQRALEHAEKFAPSKTLKNKLLKLAEEVGIDRHIAIEIANVKPDNIFTLKNITSKNSKPLDEETENKILSIIKEG